MKAVNRSLLLAEYVDVLTWSDPSVSSNIVKYRIYLNTAGGLTLLGEVAKGSSTSYRYLHRGVTKADLYRL